MTGTVKVGLEADPLFADRAQFAQTEDLESAAVGQNRPLPIHEAVQTAQLLHQPVPRPQVEVISVGRMIWALTASRSSGVMALTVALVPTGMKIGVSISPWAVFKDPRRAPQEASRCRSVKLETDKMHPIACNHEG